MKRLSLTLGFAALTLMGATAKAQDGRGTRLLLRDSSTLSLDGTSTMHGFTCRTQHIEALVEVDSSYSIVPLNTLAHPMDRVEVTIPVKSLKCGHGQMDDNMYGTLRAKDYPNITYVLGGYDLVPAEAAADSFVAKTHGMLTIAGKVNPVDMMVVGGRSPNGVAHATGSLELKMSDFGIKPPSFFFGTLRVGDKIVIKFDLSADQAAAVAAGILQQQ
ncbi:MAG: YceI family protein [Gemmatimonadaceae bacterium]